MVIAGEKGQEGEQKRQPGRVESSMCSAGFSFIRLIRALGWRLWALQPLQRPALGW